MTDRPECRCGGDWVPNCDRCGDDGCGECSDGTLQNHDCDRWDEVQRDQHKALVASLAEFADRLTARLPEEGCDRCACGCKYWDGDRCHSCGERFVP